MKILAILTASLSATMALALDDIPEDLSEWTEHGVVLRHGNSGEWDSKALLLEPVGVTRKDGTYYLFYRAGFDGCWDVDEDTAHMSVGLATSTDGVNFSKYVGNPVLTPQHFVSVESHEEGIRTAAIEFIPSEGRWIGYFAVESPGGDDFCPHMGSTAQCACNISVNASIFAASSPDATSWSVDGEVSGVYNGQENYIDDLLYRNGSYYVWSHRAEGGQTHHASSGTDYLSLSPLGEIPELCWGWSHVSSFLHDDGNTVTLIYDPRGGCASDDNNSIYFSRTSLGNMSDVSNEHIVHDRIGERSNIIIKDTENGLWRWYYNVAVGEDAGTIQLRTHPLESSGPEEEEEEASFNGFEEGFGGWMQGPQNDWFVSTQRSTSGSRSAEVDGRASNSVLVSPVIDLQGGTESRISFSWYIESGLDNGEYLAFDISSDGGSTWTEQARLRGNIDPENAWIPVTLQLTDLESVVLRFRGSMSRASEDANVDDVRVVVHGGGNEEAGLSTRITTPGDGETVVGSVTVSADASADDGIAMVEFFIDEVLVYSDSSLPYELSWGTTSENDGVHTISVTATDIGGRTATDTVSVIVDNVTAPPTITSTPDTLAREAVLYSYQLTAIDPDEGDVVIYSLTNAPSGMTINEATGLIEWVPGAGDVGAHFIDVAATDGAGQADTQSFTLTVEAAPAGQEVVLFSDGFEGGFAWQQDYQNDWFQSTQRAVSGARSAEVDGWAWNSQLRASAIDLQGYSNVSIAFSWYIDSSVDTREYLAFDVSTDGGLNWVEQARLRGNVDQEDVWHAVGIDLTGISSLSIRFRGRMSSSAEDGNVDDIVITGE